MVGFPEPARSSSVSIGFVPPSSSRMLGLHTCSNGPSTNAAGARASRSRCRTTRALPSNTSRDKPWSGYNWYQGQHRSLIQVNTDLPIYIDRAIDLAATKAIPDTTVYNVLLEQQMVRERGWVEFTVYPLFSPESLIAEGRANFGIEVAFPGDDARRVRARRAVAAGRARPSQSRPLRRASMRLVARLSYAGNEAARRYLDGADRSRGGGGVADAVRADVAGAGGAADAVHGRSIAAT